jgi:hypothetical protein
MSRLNDLTGKKFGLLHVIERVENDGKHPQWFCRCECGNEKVIRGYNLTYNGMTSCGCQTRPSHFIHGFSHKERLYTIWKGMQQRCTDPNWKGAKYYIEKGVSVCDEWRDYPVFREWALSSGYTEGLSIDRINNDGNYCPENCRWTTPKTQANNQSRNRWLTFNGETKTMSEWADIVGIPYHTIKRRIYSGWPIERTLTTPVKEHKPYGSP